MIKFCSLVSGSSGNCVLVSDEKTNILIDCGISKRRVIDLLSRADVDAKDIDAILVTHEHSDHIGGIGVMSRAFDIPVYANEPTWAAMESSIGKIDNKNIRYINSNESFEIKSIGAVSFDTPHDASSPVGYSFEAGGLKMSIATDMGCEKQNVTDALCGSDIVLLESNHDVQMLKNGTYPAMLKKRILGKLGHLSNEAAANIATTLLKNGTRAILLGHLSEQNNMPDIAYSVVKKALCEAGAKIDKDIRLAVASKSDISGMF